MLRDFLERENKEKPRFPDEINQLVKISMSFVESAFLGMMFKTD